MIRTPLRRLGLAALTGILAAGALAAPAAAAGRGTVQGTYTTDSGTPIANAFVSAYSAELDWLRDTLTDEQGRYTLRNVTAGDIKLSFENNGVRQWAHRAADFESADTFTLAENQTLTVDDRQLPTGTITGVVDEPSGGPAQYFTVNARRTGDEGAISYAFADESGRYSVDVLPGTYQVSFLRDATQQWAFGKTDQASAATITVAAGQTVEVDDTFLPAGSLGGRLSTPDGGPLAQIGVTLHRPYDPDADASESWVAETYTDENGVYSFSGVLAGEYRVSFTASDNAPRQWLRGTVDPAAAAVFTVTADQHTVADDVQMRTATVAGRLTDPSGAGLAGYAVEVSLESDDELRSYEATTGADGSWSVDGVYAGSYVVSFNEPGSARRQYAYGKGTRRAAERITVAQGATVTVNDTWLPGATLAVTPVDSVTGAPVTDFCAHLWEIDISECTEGSELILSDLPEGTFNLEVSPQEKSFHLRSGERPVTLAPGRTTTESVPLEQGGKAAVTVVDAVTGEPVSDVCFTLRKPNSGGIGEGYGDCTGATGKSSTIAMKAGTYQIFAIAREGGYGNQWVGPDGGTGDQREAAKITLRPGKFTKAPVVKMDQAGTITGTVTGDDGQPIGGADVGYSAWDYGTGPSWTTTTDAQGRYTLNELGPYSWPLVFTAPGYARQWSGGGGNRYQATKIAVTAGGSTTYDMGLVRGSVLRGTVTVRSSQPVDGWRLTAVNAATGDPIGVADYTALENGDYEMPVAGGQQVKIRWSLHGADSWQDGWYDGAADQAAATKVSVPRTGTRTLNLTIGR